MSKFYKIIPIVFIVMIYLSSATTGDYRWTTVKIGGGGFVSAIIADPKEENLFYARTDVGGAYRWDEKSKSWIPLLDWVSSEERSLLGVEAIAVDPIVKGRVYLTAGTSYWNDGKSMFLRSDDYGRTWQKIDVTSQFKIHGNGMGRANGERLAIDPNNNNIIFCGTRWNGLFKSTNRGESWTKVNSLNINSTPNENGICFVVIDKNSVKDGRSQIIYVGVSRENENLYVSKDGGETWTLIEGRPTTAGIMPQRALLSDDGVILYVTYGNGAGPHPQQWGGVNHYYNRGAVYKYNTKTGVWTNISPVNFMAGLDSLTSSHYGAYSGISIDPSNPARIVVSSINSWRGPQYWKIDGKWKDFWGDNIFISEDSGKTWLEMFKYLWVDGGVMPEYKMMDENGIPWIIGNTIHWIGSVVIDPFNPNRVFVTSGNGVFVTENCWEKIEKSDWEKTYYETRAVWKFASHGIEETVPLDLVSIPGGPLVSVIGDYDGFVHTDVTKYPLYRHKNQDGTSVGTTTGLAYAANKINVLVKVANDEAKTSWGGKINPVAISKDTGKTWQPCSNLPEGGEYHSGKVAISCDGEVIVWAPYIRKSDGSSSSYNGMFRTIGGGFWTKCNGIDFYSYPVADPVNKDKFYAYDKNSGYVFVSTDGGQSFSKAGLAGSGGFITMRATPGKEGHLWIPLGSGGLTYSEDGGNTFTKVNNVSYCEAIGFGKEAPGKDYPTIYIYGTIENVTGVFQSIDKGNSWVRVNDDQHQYGGPANGEFIVGDMNIFGVVYMSTAGRGIACRLPAEMVNVSTAYKNKELYDRKIINITKENIVINTNEKTQISIYDLKGRILYRKEIIGKATISLKKEKLAPNKTVVVRVKNNTTYFKKICCF